MSDESFPCPSCRKVLPIEAALHDKTCPRCGCEVETLAKLVRSAPSHRQEAWRSFAEGSPDKGVRLLGFANWLHRG